MTTLILDWFNRSSVGALEVILIAGMVAAFALTYIVRSRRGRKPDPDSQEGYVLSAILGLLALLIGFTFSLAINRFEARRELVVTDSNAIGTAYLRAQLLDEPHRTRLSELLIAYTENMIALAKTPPGRTTQRLATDDKLLHDIWAATAAAFDQIEHTPFVYALITSMNTVIDIDATRRAARQVHIPTEVFAFLFVYLITTSAMLGHLLIGRNDRIAAAILLAFLAVSVLLIIDIDRPTGGGIRESQAPMEQLLQSLRSHPPSSFDHWRAPPIQP